MFRPATPLSVLLLVAFGLLTLSVLSTPIIKAVPLGTFGGYDYGVFGYCKGDACSGFEIGYKVTTETDSASDFDLPGSTRDTLTSILIVHPVAALMALTTLVMAFISHLHSPAHSSRYLLAVAILNFLAFLVSLLAFLTDVLVFIPHMAWGSYLVLAATIILFISSIMTCAMRRTLVSRKSRKKQIANHAEMSGENYYAREAAIKASNIQAEPVPSIPTMSGGQSGNDGLPVFASFESTKKAPSDALSDEHVPLTSQSPVQRSASTDRNGYNRSGSAPPPQVDLYGNPTEGSPGRVYNMGRNPSMDRVNSRGRGGAQNFRGRGGYGGGRSGYGGPGPNNGSYGGPNGNPNYRSNPPRHGTGGGYGGPGRGDYQNDRFIQGYRQDSMYNQQTYAQAQEYANLAKDPYANNGPQLSYNNIGYVQPNNSAPNLGYDNTVAPGYNQQSGYSQSRNSVNGKNFIPYSHRQLSIDSYNALKAQNPDANSQDFDFGLDANGNRMSLPRAESPPPLSAEVAAAVVSPVIEEPENALVEMEGSPAVIPPAAQNVAAALRDNDSDVAGMVSMQQGKMSEEPRQTYISDVSKYSQDGLGYAPSATSWNPTAARPSALPAPLTLGGGISPSAPPMPDVPENQVVSRAAYYEDVDPQYANDISLDPAPSQTREIILPPPEVTIDDIPGNMNGPRSPGAESDLSNFTSISQRGINPQWDPNAPPVPLFDGVGVSQRGPPQGYKGPPGRGPPGSRGLPKGGPPGPRGPPRGGMRGGRRPPPGAGGPRRPPPQQQKQDLLLNSNPDFALPGKR